MSRKFISEIGITAIGKVSYRVLISPKAETISLNSASEVFAIQGGEEIQPNFEIDFSELMILTPGGSQY